MIKYSHTAQSNEYDLKENVRFERFYNNSNPFFETISRTNLDRKYIIDNFLSKHNNYNMILQNGNNILVMYIHINDSCVRKDEFKVSSFFTKDEIQQYQQQVSSSYKDYIPVGFVWLSEFENKHFSDNKLFSIELFETFYTKRNFGELMLHKLDSFLDDGCYFFPRDIIKAEKYWIKKVDLIKNQLSYLSDDMIILDFFKLFVSTFHTKWTFDFLNTLINHNIRDNEERFTHDNIFEVWNSQHSSNFN